jgi:ubiquinone/menaquinone biosynthesis C-methylase UbiE
LLETKPYATQFTNRNAAEEYERIVYSPNSYSTYIWQLQIPVLLRLIRSSKKNTEPVKLLDFACGTGRILSLVESKVDQSDGIDVSSAMTEFARTKCEKSNFYVGNILDQPNILVENYDVITCFRFLLNTEPDNRIKILKELRKRLIAKNGILIANIHGNTYSIRSLALLYRRIVHKEQHIQMSRKEIHQMFQLSGFRILSEEGFGILPPVVYRTPLKTIAKWIDKQSNEVSFLKLFSVDLLYVCEPLILENE